MNPPNMVANSTTTEVKMMCAKAYASLCANIRADLSLSVIVVNHISTKHSIHTLPAFHTSKEISDDVRLSTYHELVTALSALKNGQPREIALAALNGGVAKGQAASRTEPPAPPSRIPDPDPVPEPDPVKDDGPLDLDGWGKPKDVPLDRPVPPPPPKRSDDPFTERLRALLIEVIGDMPSANIDEAKVNEVVTRAITDAKHDIENEIKALHAKLKKLGEAAPTVVRHEFKIGDTIKTLDGLVHRQIPQIIAWLSAGIPVWLWGGAGAAKTHGSRQVAEAMGLPYYEIAIDETMTVGKLVGFRNVVNGEFVPTRLYKAWKEGGVVLFDEGDTNSTAIAALNSMLANARYTFPNDEDVPRHPNFRVIFGANTKGTGAVAGYTARVRLDAATLDRFAVIRMEYDFGLERAICLGGPSATVPWKGGEPGSEALCEKYVTWVQAIRTKFHDVMLISPRASVMGVRALRVGIPIAEVAEALVFKLVTPDTRARIIRECGNIPNE